MPIVTRASTFSVFSNTIQNINKVQADLFDSQDQLSSGLKTDRFSGLQGQVEQFVFLEGRISQVRTYQEIMRLTYRVWKPHEPLCSRSHRSPMRWKI